MYNRTTSGYSTQNQTRFTPNYEPTVSDNPYASSPYDLQKTPLPPKPPHVQKKVIFALGIVMVVLLVIVSGLVFGLMYMSNNKPLFYHVAATQVSRTKTAQVPTATPIYEYTASDVLQAFIMSGASPTVLDHNKTIWGWTSELGSPYYVSVHAKSSMTFRDTSGCSGPCDGFLNGGIWVYSDYATTYQAYIDATKDQEQQLHTPPTGPTIIPSVYRHGRCLLLGPGNDSIYTIVVTRYCV